MRLAAFNHLMSYVRPYIRIGVASGSFCQFFGNVSIGNGTRLGHRVLLANSEIGKNSKINARVTIGSSTLGSFVVIHKESIIDTSSIGRFSYVGPQGQIGMTEMGSFCSVGPGLICGYGEHPADFVSSSPVFYSMHKQCGITFAQHPCFEEHKKISIGNDVWIGARVFIRDGIRIGDGAIVGAGSVVVKDVPAYAIVGGVPAKIIKYRFGEKEIARLLALEWWNWDEARLREAQPYFANSNLLDFLNKYSVQEVIPE